MNIFINTHILFPSIYGRIGRSTIGAGIFAQVEPIDRFRNTAVQYEVKNRLQFLTVCEVKN
jgi:hypothetical protein